MPIKNPQWISATSRVMVGIYVCIWWWYWWGRHAAWIFQYVHVLYEFMMIILGQLFLALS